MRAPHNQIRPDRLRDDEVPVAHQRIRGQPEPGQALVRFLPEWTGPTTTITPGDSVRVIARRLITTLSTLNMIGQHRATTTWQRRMRFRGLKFDSDTSGAAAVFATVRSGAARRNQEI